MRIGLDYRPATAAPSSGIGRQVLAMEQALRGMPQDQLLLYTAAPANHPHRQFAHCPAASSPVQGLHRPTQRWRFEHEFLPQALRDDDLDVYIATANSGLPVGRVPKTLRQVLLLHDVFQLTLRNHHRSSLRALAYRLIDRVAIGHAVAAATAIWTPSQFTAAETARLFPRHADKLRVLPNAVTPPAIADTPVPDRLPARYWLLVGSREPRKNVPLFLEAWQRARQHGEPVPAVVLIGTRGDLPAPLRALPDLHVFGGIEDAVLATIYARAERLWQPAYAEGFGLPVIEALGHGTAVAVARGSALDEIVPPESPRFDPHDRNALTQLMLRLAGVPVESDAAARRAFAARYAPDAYARRLRDLLDELRR